MQDFFHMTSIAFAQSQGASLTASCAGPGGSALAKSYRSVRKIGAEEAG